MIHSISTVNTRLAGLSSARHYFYTGIYLYFTQPTKVQHVCTYLFQLRVTSPHYDTEIRSNIRFNQQIQLQIIILQDPNDVILQDEAHSVQVYEACVIKVSQPYGFYTLAFISRQSHKIHATLKVLKVTFTTVMKDQRQTLSRNQAAKYNTMTFQQHINAT